MLGERFGMTMSQQRIVISHGLQDWVKKKFNRNSTLIPNGVLLPEMVESDGALQEFSLTKQRYVLTVSRLVPEKRHLDLINAFLMANLPDWKLVIVGGSDHPDDYTRELHELANQHANVVMTGVQKGLALKELFVHAGCFVLASSHEGLPIALLEALSYGLPCIASDIPANLEVELPENHYYNLGDVQALAKLLEEFSQHEHSDEEKKELRQWVTTSYNWKDISQQTLAVYQSILNP
jgi:glycosyltransferase involved in cell wall biosynthesis